MNKNQSSLSSTSVIKNRSSAVEQATRSMTASVARSRDEMGRYLPGAKAAEDATKKAAGSFGSLGRIAKTVIGPIGGIIAAFTALKVVSDTTRLLASFEFELAKLRAVSGATDKQMQALEATARRLGATTRYSASEAASALVELAKAGLTVNQQLAALPGTLDLATVGLIGLDEAATIIVRTLAQFKLDAIESARVVDVLAAAANASLTDVDGIALALSQAGAQASNIGLSIEQTAAALGILANNALQGFRGGTNLRGVLTALLKPTKEAGKEFAALGIAAKDVDVTVVGLSAALKRLRDANLDVRGATAIFGRQIAGGALALVNNADAVDALEESLKNAQGTAERFAAQLNNTIIGQALSLKSAFQELQLQVGDTGLSGAIKDFRMRIAIPTRRVAGSCPEAALSNSVM